MHTHIHTAGRASRSVKKAVPLGVVQRLDPGLRRGMSISRSIFRRLADDRHTVRRVALRQRGLSGIRLYMYLHIRTYMGVYTYMYICVYIHISG